MLIANGFITETPSQAFLLCDRCDGHEVRTTPLPTVETMTYWLNALLDFLIKDTHPGGCFQSSLVIIVDPVTG